MYAHTCDIRFELDLLTYVQTSNRPEMCHVTVMRVVDWSGLLLAILIGIALGVCLGVTLLMTMHCTRRR